MLDFPPARKGGEKTVTREAAWAQRGWVYRVPPKLVYPSSWPFSWLGSTPKTKRREAYRLNRLMDGWVSHSEHYGDITKASCIEAYLRGDYLEDIGRRFEVNPATIYRWMKERGTNRDPRHGKVWEGKISRGERHHSYGLRRKPVTMRHPDEATLAYIAGFFDGEGSTGVSNNGSRNVFLAITNTDIRPLQFIVESIGGKIYGPMIRRGALGSKPQYTWIAGGMSNQEFFLEMLLPHLKCKREAAVKVLERLKDNAHPRRGR